ncbi:MAG: class B sortase [Lachnospiraceae bacterium]|nr:class B sortase [Lachnospiraceae bacterium]
MQPIEVLPPPEPLEKYSQLLEVNPYLAGWLEIDGTKINDPVVYTPGSQNYFLHRALDGTPSEKGTFFIAINWQEGFNNTLIYGHNMKDGSGFGALTAFADESYGLSHPIIRFDTLYEDREYELFAAFYSQIDEEELETDADRAAADQKIEERSVAKKQEEAEAAAEAGEEPPPVIDPSQFTVADLDLHRDFGFEDIYRGEKDDDRGRFRYYYYTDLSDRADFDYYVNNIKERALYDTGVDAEWGDEFVTLSTCSYQVKNGRFVVVGVRHAENH